jgi:hypothetical protein
MAEIFESVVGFLVVLALPLVLVAGGLVSLFAVGALFDALDNPQDLRGRIEGAFRRPPRPPRQTRPDHYYRPFWAGGS